ncbi:hypothetical protein OAC89_03575 [Deltaproteobacteria bacterium]|nr:hypothetical protein [Deltaproteobacteria bacterium]
MKFTDELIAWTSLVLCVLLCSGCSYVAPFNNADEFISDEKEAIEETVQQDLGEEEVPVQASIDSNSEVPHNMEPPSEEISPSAQEASSSNALLNNTYNPTDQELVDTALDYCQASNDFWEQGDLDNALDALDKAYSLTLNVNSDNAEVLQQKEDLRFTISKRIIEVYSSRFTVANGTHKAIPLVMNSYVKKGAGSLQGQEQKVFPGVLRPFRKVSTRHCQGT